MKIGWLRLWAVCTGLLLAFSVYFTWTSPNIVGENGSGWSCVPGSRVARLEQQEDGYYEPTSFALRQDTQRRLAEYPKEISFMAEVDARNALRTIKYKNVELHDCTSYGELLLSILRAGLIALGVAAVFLVGRWVAKGFKVQL